MSAISKGYKYAVKWIADNDETACTDHEEIKTLISVVLTADLFGVTPDKVADDVLRARCKSNARYSVGLD